MEEVSFVNKRLCCKGRVWTVVIVVVYCLSLFETLSAASSVVVLVNESKPSLELQDLYVRTFIETYASMVLAASGLHYLVALFKSKEKECAATNCYLWSLLTCQTIKVGFQALSAFRGDGDVTGLPCDNLEGAERSTNVNIAQTGTPCGLEQGRAKLNILPPTIVVCLTAALSVACIVVVRWRVDELWMELQRETKPAGSGGDEDPTEEG